MNWTALKDELPPDELFVLLTGPSGTTNTPNFMCLGRRYTAYRPPINGRVRWLDTGNTDFSDRGWEPTHWGKCPELPPAPKNTWRVVRSLPGKEYNTFTVFGVQGHDRLLLADMQGREAVGFRRDCAGCSSKYAYQDTHGEWCLGCGS